MSDLRSINRREFIGVAGLTAASLLARDARAQEPRRPNILLLQTDQQHFATLGCAGHPVIQTPNLDRLAADGVMFTRGTCVTPFCSPTRASWVTGQWPHTHGLMLNVQGDAPWLTDETPNLPNILHDAGYACAHFGKWHLGRTEDIRAYAHQGPVKEQNRGYNQYVGKGLNLDPAKVEAPRVGLQHIDMIPSVAAFHARWKDEERRSQQDLSIIGKSDLPPEYQYESWLSDQCIKFINASKDGPFFATYSVSPPHAFWIAPEPYYSMYGPEDVVWPESWEDRPKFYQQSQPLRMVEGLGEEGVREYLRCYYAQVTMMDAFMGRIIDRLRELGLYDNTAIILTSDHGDMQGAHGAIGKSLPAAYDEIVRVPFVAKTPGGRSKATSTTHVQSVDVMPTVLDYAGLPAPASVQGESIRRLIEGKYGDDERPAFCERGRGFGGMRLIRSGEWKYAVHTGPKGGRRNEMFSLGNDPWEMQNLAELKRYNDLQQYLDGQLRAGLEQQEDDVTVKAFWG